MTRLAVRFLARLAAVAEGPFAVEVAATADGEWLTMLERRSA